MSINPLHIESQQIQPQLKSNHIQTPASIPFSITTDSHKCLHLTILSLLPLSYQTFQQSLQQIQIEQKLSTHSKAIWVHLNQYNLKFIELLLQKKYIIHRGVKNQVSLYKWTNHNQNIKDNIPPYSRVYIGCGAVLIKNNHIFLVKEKSGDRKGYFGLPGGRADPGQVIQQAVVRQLYQQTSIKSQFQYIIYFRQLPKSLWGSSDIYFVCLVSAEQDQYNNIKLCENQISEYKWVHLKHYAQFIQQNGAGTQVHVSKYITELYQKGYDLNKKSNLSRQKHYNSKSTTIMTEHLLTGIDQQSKKQKQEQK